MRLRTRIQRADDILVAGVGLSLNNDGCILTDTGELHHRVAETEDIIHGGAVDDDVVLVLDVQHDVERHARGGDFGADQWELRVDALLAFGECRKAHVENEQNQDRVDHRDDLDARALHRSSFELHLSSVAKVTSAMPALAQTFMKALRSL